MSETLPTFCGTPPQETHSLHTGHQHAREGDRQKAIAEKLRKTVKSRKIAKNQGPQSPALPEQGCSCFLCCLHVSSFPYLFSATHLFHVPCSRGRMGHRCATRVSYAVLRRFQRLANPSRREAPSTRNEYHLMSHNPHYNS